MQECTTVLFHRKKTKNNHKNIRKTCYWKLIFVICSIVRQHVDMQSTLGTLTRWHVSTQSTQGVRKWARRHPRHVGTWARDQARHVGTWEREYSRHFDTWALKHARHVRTWSRKQARHISPWARKARNLADSKQQYIWSLKQMKQKLCY